MIQVPIQQSTDRCDADDYSMPRSAASLSPRRVEFITRTISLATQKGVALSDITQIIRALVGESRIEDGVMLLSSLHTTTALFINESQNALLEDVVGFLEQALCEQRMSPHVCDFDGGLKSGYKHNCKHCSDCERKNAAAHLGAILLGHSVSVPISKGELTLGKWQSLMFAELDGPRTRNLTVQIFGYKLADSG